MRTSMQGSYCHQNIKSPPVKQLMFFLGYSTTISLTVTSAQSWESRHLIIQAHYGITQYTIITKP